jgi:hypothetical protein
MFEYKKPQSLKFNFFSNTYSNENMNLKPMDKFWLK